MSLSASSIVSLGRTPGGKSLYGSRWTRYHWDKTMRALAREFPAARVYILQGAYNKGFAPSAGTHDYDGVLDVWVTGISWRDAEQFFRRQGWAAWWRHTGSWAATSKFHIHMISIGCPNRMGSLIASQLAAFKAHRLGLARSVDGPDPAPHPARVDYFDYTAWLRQLEEDRMNHVQKADRALEPVIKGLDEAIRELRQVEVRRTRVRAKIAGLVAARATVAATAKFLTV